MSMATRLLRLHMLRRLDTLKGLWLVTGTKHRPTGLVTSIPSTPNAFGDAWGGLFTRKHVLLVEILPGKPIKGSTKDHPELRLRLSTLKVPWSKVWPMAHWPMAHDMWASI